MGSAHGEVPPDEEERVGVGAVTNIPGAKRQDTGERKSRQEVRTLRVAFSPGGNEFCAVTTEGMLIYRLDEDLAFDPIALTEDVTPNAVNNCVSRGMYGQALIMALLLNETPLIAMVVDGTPNASIALVCRSVTQNHFVRFLHFLADKIADTPHIEFYLNWLQAFAKAHGKRIEKGGSKFVHAIRAVTKSVKTRENELKHCLADNVYTLEWTKTSLESALSKIEEANKV
jgi:periodic tryptophan protein 2